MATVASLFESQAEATTALDALADSEFSEVDIRVYEKDVPDERGDVIPAGFPSSSTNVSGSGAAAVSDSAITNLGDEELSDFFVNAVERGEAVLVVADVDDDRVAALQAFFSDHGGRTAKDE